MTSKHGVLAVVALLLAPTWAPGADDLSPGWLSAPMGHEIGPASPGEALLGLSKDRSQAIHYRPEESIYPDDLPFEDGWLTLASYAEQTMTDEPERLELWAPFEDEEVQSGEGEMSYGWSGNDLDSVHDAFDQSGSPQLLQQSAPCEHDVPCRRRLAVRFGWWDVNSDGNPTKVGEYEGLESSPFYDVDSLLSDGVKTYDFHGTGLDEDGSQVGLRYLKPGGSARVDYQRFLRRLDHDPLTGFNDVQQQTPGGDLAVKEDLNVGEDYAIRVQELNADFQGKLTQNIKWRLNIWGMRKHGERQVTAMAHCFTPANGSDVNGNPVGGIACHVLSQRQRIDWLTTEIEPVLEGKFGATTVEYSRTMRTFSQDDQITTRPYDNFGFSGDLPYAVVPDNYTEIDRLKMGANVSESQDFYAQLYTGNTLNRFRDTNRRFRGLDLRLMDCSIDGVHLTGYFKKYVQTGQRPQDLLPLETAADVNTPIAYEQSTAGLKGRWQPFRGEYSLRSGFALNGGYEYRGLERENALFAEQALTVNESFTDTNLVHVRASMRWAPQLDTYVRYRLAFIDDPLFGVPVRNTATNTSLPTQEHLVEIGSSWVPTESFLLSASFGINNSWNSSDVANFQEDDYPIVLTAWYAPTPKWSVSGGLAFYSNWIDQDITLGSKSDPVTLPWNYGGQSDVLNVGTTYAWTECLTLSGGFEFVRGRNAFDPLSLWPDLAALSDVIVEITRFSAGVDYELRRGIDCYFRYQFSDYDDKSETFNSGTANMFLTGLNAIY